MASNLASHIFWKEESKKQMIRSRVNVAIAQSRKWIHNSGRDL